MQNKNYSRDPYTLGLDIGIASVGAALLAENRILGLHVRTFEKAETAKEGESLNKIRREARSARRRLARRRLRLVKLRELFKQFGLTDTDSVECFLGNTSPWFLRAEGLDRLLSATEWAAVIYHIIKHRGFQSTRKSEKKEQEAGAMLSAISQNQSELEASDYRTVGELLARDEKFSSQKRNKAGEYSHTLSRQSLTDEIRLLFERQRELNNPHTQPEFEEEVKSLLLFRKPALSGEALLDMLGFCSFEPDEHRAPKASYSAEYFVWLGKLNNLRISQNGTTRSLTDEERDILIQYPFIKTKLSYKQVRKLLNLDASASFNGLKYSEKDPEGTTLFEAKAFHAIRRAYQDNGLDLLWQRDSQDKARLDKIAYALTIFKEDDEAIAWMAQQNIEQTVIDAVLNESFSDFIRLSQKALDKIIPFMEQGQDYDEAVQSAGYEHHSDLRRSQKQKYLPRLPKSAFTNPVVARAVNQARKLINAIVREYGSPTAVHIELARDLSRSSKERYDIEKEQKKYRENKESDIAYFEESFGFKPKGAQFTKWRLYREQDGKCAYSLKPLDIDRVVNDAGYAEIDHALPYSRSFNDGMVNKVLVLTVENRNKSNLTPYEYLDGKNDSEQWHRFATWVKSNKKYSQAKRNNLLKKDFGEKEAEQFRERNLTDTRYITREVKKLIETHLQLTEGQKNCVVVSGRLTAFLRTRWGLLKVREEGDLHHALDATVVAACSRGMVKRLSDYSRRDELEFAGGLHFDPETGEVLNQMDLQALRKLEKQFPQPWPYFRQELEAWLSAEPAEGLARIPGYEQSLLAHIQPVRVSRAPTRRGLGAAHQDTIRSARYLADNKSTVKTALTKLKLKNLPDLVGYDDPRNQALINAITERLETHHDDAKKAFAEPLYKPGKPGKPASLVKSVKLFTIQKSGLPVRGGVANNGDMLRIDVFTDNKKYFVVPVYVADAVKAELPCHAVIGGKPEQDWIKMNDNYRFLFSLYPNDWVRVIKKQGQETIEGYYAGMDRSDATINLWTHDRNRHIGKDGLIRGIGVKTAWKLEKYHVDYLGRLHKVEHESRKPLRAQTGG